MQAIRGVPHKSYLMQDAEAETPRERKEIGKENFELLKTIVKKELPELEESKLKRWYQLG